MKIELTKEEWHYIKTLVDSAREVCEHYHPSDGGIQMDIYLSDEEVIRNLWDKLGDEWKDDDDEVNYGDGDLKDLINLQKKYNERQSKVLFNDMERPE